MGKLGGEKEKSDELFPDSWNTRGPRKDEERNKLFPFPDTLAVWESSLRQKQNSERSMLP